MLTEFEMSDMRVSSREFQREFARVRVAAAEGELVYVTSGKQEFVFLADKELFESKEC